MGSSIKKTDFFIVGQPKSGTTALAQFLNEHPSICMSIPKEPTSFATDFIEESDEFHGKKLFFSVRNEKEYNNIFKHCSESALRGDASTNHLYSKVAAKNIHEHNKKAKIIIMLRKPDDYLYSIHSEYVSHKMESITDFGEALKAENRRKKGNDLPKDTRTPSFLFYTDRIAYFEQVKRYYDLFPKKNILFITFDEFRASNEVVFTKVLNFLAVDSDFRPEFENVNTNKVPRNNPLARIVYNPRIKATMLKILGQHRYHKLQPMVVKMFTRNSKRDPLDPKIAKNIMAQARMDVDKTSKLVGVDLIKLWY